MKYAIIALALFVVVQAASEVGQFVPRAIYTLDSEGHQSPVHPVSARLLRRLRRQVFTSSSSSVSSSSSSSSDGTQTSYQSQAVQNPDGTTSFLQSTHHIAAPEVNSRFGEESPTSGVSSAGFSGQFSAGQYSNGQQSGGATTGNRPQHTFTTLSGTIGKDGKLHQRVTTGYVNPDGQVHQKHTSINN